MRWMAAAIGLVVLAGCHEEGRLRITNKGTFPVRVYVDYLVVYEDDECGRTVEEWRTRGATVQGGAQEKLTFPSEEMDVTIVRAGDGLPLFQAYYTPRDFEEDHGTIEIAVSP